MEPVKPKFRCSMDALYEGCDQLAINVLEELVKMAAFKAKYTVAAVDDFKAKIKAARKMDDDEQRAAKHELLRLALKKLTQEDIKTKLGALRLYIRDAYEDVEVREVNLTTAGFNDFERAMNLNWEVLRTVMEKANKFVNENTADLVAGNNMPVTFEGELSALKDEIDTKIPQFLNTRENAPQGTEAKIVASNEIYDIAISICEDGQFVFKDAAAKRKQFVWDDIMEIVTPTGKAGLRFDVKEQGTNLPLAGVTAKLQKEGDVEITTTTDADGKGKFENMQAGFYGGKLVLNDFVSLEFELEITVGVTSFKHWVMVRV